jgi:hypothetical protein
MLVVAGSLMSCNQGETVEGFADPEGPIHINLTCGPVISIGLADANGNPAWTYKVKKNDPISWEVPPTVTIDSIRGKTPADSLPLDPDGPQGGQPGTPYKSKVKNSAKDDKDYHYNIFASCNPGPNAQRFRIDPEMIVR